MTADDSLHRNIGLAAKWLAQADALVIAAGAGIGVDSGLPDFRGRSGFWAAYPALGKRGMDFTAIASPQSFVTDARLAWGFYGHRLKLYRNTQPHAGFNLLLEWAARMPHGARVFTSNVDGQFEKAGFAADTVYACHGSIHTMQCTVPCCETLWPASEFDPDVDEATCMLRGELPRCPRCGALARPNVLMFDDWAWIDGQAQRRRDLDRWLATTSRPLVLEIGAGTAVHTVRHFAQHVVRNFGGRLVRINPRESAVLNERGVGVALGALDALQGIASALDTL